MAILISNSNGGDETPVTTLEAARTGASYAGKTVTVASVLSTAQSNISGAWPSDRKLVVAKGGQIAPTTAFTGLDYAEPGWFSTFQKSVDSVAAGGLFRVDGPHTVTSVTTVSKAITIAGTGTITQSTSATGIFSATVDGVTFDGLTLVGNSPNTADDPFADTDIAIEFVGTQVDPRANCVVRNCKISDFVTGIRARWNNGLSVDNCVMSNVLCGIYGGVTGDPATYQNDSGDQSYNITNCQITCTFGLLIWSRPVFLPGCAGYYRVDNCVLRGGGMAIEGVLNSATLTLTPRVFITNNDADTSFSIASHSSVIGNKLDLNNSPIGRGIQASYYQAIEAGVWTSIIGNTIQNYPNGVGALQVGMIVSGNRFLNCATSEAGNGAIIYLPATGDAAITADTTFDVVISNNIFESTGTTAADISIQSGATHGFNAIGFTITGNTSNNAASEFLIITGVSKSTVSDNIINNAGRLKASNAFGIYEIGAASSVNYHNNIFTNTLVTNGMDRGMLVGSASTVGFQQFSGMITSAFYSMPNFYTSQTHMEDGVLMSYQRVNAGTPVGALTPLYIGEMVLDNVASDFYIAYSTTNASWKKLTP